MPHAITLMEGTNVSVITGSLETEQIALMLTNARTVQVLVIPMQLAQILKARIPAPVYLGSQGTAIIAPISTNVELMVQIRVMTMQLAPILKVPTIALAILDTTEMERTAPILTNATIVQDHVMLMQLVQILKAHIFVRATLDIQEMDQTVLT